MICDALQTWTRTRTGPGLGGGLGVGWGGGSWGWAFFFFLCFVIVEYAHGHAYAKQVRIMCVLSVPLLDQVWGGNRQKIIRGVVFRVILRAILEMKIMLNSSVFDGFHKKHQK